MKAAKGSGELFRSLVDKFLRFFNKEIISPSVTFAAVRTPRAQVESLIDSLRPVATDKELIRLGPNTDGGYLVPNDLDGIEACFSPGVSLVSGFELDCANRGMRVFMADKSVDGPVDSHDLFSFIPKFVGASSSGDFITLNDWVESEMPGSNQDLMLQMDIEGHEYEVLLNATDSLLDRFRVIVVELHRLEQLWNYPTFLMFRSAIGKLTRNHQCVHIHPNNSYRVFAHEGLEIPSIAEFTFLRKDRQSSSRPVRQFPHRLDFDSTPKPSISLPRCWYESSSTAR